MFAEGASKIYVVCIPVRQKNLLSTLMFLCSCSHEALSQEQLGLIVIPSDGEITLVSSSSLEDTRVGSTSEEHTEKIISS